MAPQPDLLCFEREAWESGFLWVCGVDEAGRGPLAGPVVAAAALFEREYLAGGIPPELAGLTDSKALTEKRRAAFFEQFQTLPALCFSTGLCTAQEIDEINILNAAHRAMARAVRGLKKKPQRALVDGLPVRGLPCSFKAVVKGDALSLSIAAASVVAKVTRDRMMRALDARHPEYGFARHKGYGTREHLDALKRLGPLPCHRMTFKPLSERAQLRFEW
jgi:ribonuclease HII